MGSPTFSWASKVRQFRAHLGARVRPDERVALAAWLTPAQLALFDGMHVADRRHGLDVVATLRAGGSTDQELLVAGLLHDCAKGPGVGVLPRVAWSLGEAWGPWVDAPWPVICPASGRRSTGSATTPSCPRRWRFSPVARSGPPS